MIKGSIQEEDITIVNMLLNNQWITEEIKKKIQKLPRDK